jgi:hypothetical protein
MASAFDRVVRLLVVELITSLKTDTYKISAVKRGETNRYRPFIKVFNSILETLAEPLFRAELEHLGLFKRQGKRARIILQRYHPNWTTTHYNGKKGDLGSKVVNRQPGIVILSLHDALGTCEEGCFDLFKLPDDELFRRWARDWAWRVPGGKTRALPFSQVKMCFDFKTRHAISTSEILRCYEDDVEMVAEICYPEDTRRSEVDMLKLTYSIAGRAKGEEDRGHIEGHLPLLVASHSWPAKYVRWMDNVLKPAALKSSRKSRCLRILVFVKLRPIQELPHKQFVKSFFDWMLCEHASPYQLDQR